MYYHGFIVLLYNIRKTVFKQSAKHLTIPPGVPRFFRTKPLDIKSLDYKDTSQKAKRRKRYEIAIQYRAIGMKKSVAGVLSVNSNQVIT